MKARIEIRLKAGILDPQGKAIGGALGGLGYQGLGEVRQGKLIEIDLPHATDKAAAEKEVAAMCKTLLANTVIENFRIEHVKIAAESAGNISDTDDLVLNDITLTVPLADRLKTENNTDFKGLDEVKYK